jgi:hypothetical protein
VEGCHAGARPQGNCHDSLALSPPTTKRRERQLPSPGSHTLYPANVDPLIGAGVTKRFKRQPVAQSVDELADEILEPMGLEILQAVAT